jgi:hypothetical protein
LAITTPVTRFRVWIGEAAAAVLHQLAVADHRAEPARQRFGTVRGGQAQACAQFLGRLRPFATLQQGQDGLAAGDGLFVLLASRAA